jgi:signal transduction histidine kinase
VGDPTLSSELARLEEHAATAVDRLRRLLFEIEPVELERGGVAVALRTSLEQASQEDGLEFELVDRTSRSHSHAVRSLLYRVGREALANVRNHAQASRVEVQLEDDDEGFALEVRDDGRGFDPEHGLRVRPGHLGLPAMRERVEITGGRLNLESRPGSGTALRVWLPDLEAA